MVSGFENAIRPAGETVADVHSQAARPTLAGQGVRFATFPPLNGSNADTKGVVRKGKQLAASVGKPTPDHGMQHQYAAK